MLDLSKHLMFFDPRRLEGSVAVVGVGAIGSAVALSLAKLGVPKLTLFDPDVVEPHNLPNQLLYGPSDIGEPKVYAAAKRIRELSKTEVVSVAQRVGAGKRLQHAYVFCCVDSMAARDEVFNRCVFANGITSLYFDGRMDAQQVWAIGFSAGNLPQIKAYRESLYSDDEVVKAVGGCGITPSVGATAQLAANLMTWLFMDQVMERPSFNEVFMSVKTMEVFRRSYPQG